MKLVAAKCPSCGASLKVDPSDKTFKCEYCQQTILIDDAIGKLNSVEIKNLPQRDNILKLADRNFKAKNYEEAYEEYDQLLKFDPDNPDFLIRYAICKTLLNNYIDFTLDYLIKTYDNVLEILKGHNDYAEKNRQYVYEIQYAIDVSLNSTIQYYNSYLINKSDLMHIQRKMLTCLKLYEKIFEQASEEIKSKIAKSILLTIDSIIEDKAYKTGSDSYGQNFVESYVIDKETKIVLLQKKELYINVVGDEFVATSKLADKSRQVTSKLSDTFVKMISIAIGIILPPVGILFIWILGRNLGIKDKMIVTLFLSIWFAILLICV